VLDVIKEYLVSLGFKVDDASLRQAQNAMNQADKFVRLFANSTVTQFAIAGAGVATFVAVANLGIAKFMESLAKSDLEYAKFARQMWTSKEQAKALKDTLDAMGVTMEDLYLSPELLQQFKELREQAFEMVPPDEYASQMKFIRSIGFEFQRLKLEATYAMQWIGYYLFKYLEKPLGNLKAFLKNFNDGLTKSMPEWTKQIAQVVSWFVRLGIAGVKAGQTIIELFQKLPNSIKIAGGAFVGLFTLLKMGPIGWIIAGLMTLLLLLDDYYTYQNGGKSAFGGMWQEIDKFKDRLKDDGTLDEFIQNLDELMKSVFDLVDAVVDLGIEIGKLLDTLAQAMGFKDFTDLLEQTLLVVLKKVNEAIRDITDGIKDLTDLLKGDFESIWDRAMNKMNSGKKPSEKSGLENFIDGILGQMPGLGPLFQGKQQYGNIGNTLQQSGMGYILPQSKVKVPVSSNMSNTFNIYGNDAYAIGVSVQRNMGDLTRSTQGVLI
jgi:hypothetical protein